MFKDVFKEIEHTTYYSIVSYNKQLAYHTNVGTPL